jgi:3-oxoacyl-[acyl-carrier-protein] synthase II
MARERPAAGPPEPTPSAGRRVVATGLGVVSCLGQDLPEHWRRLVAGESGVRRLDGALAAVLPVKLQAPVVRFSVEERIRNRMLRKLLLPSATFAVAAAGEALADARLADDGARLERCGLYFGSVGYEVPGRTFEPALRSSFDAGRAFSFARFAEAGMEQVDPLLIVKGLPNAAPCGAAIEHGIRGPNASFANGPASGLQAALAAFVAIRFGVVDVALVGGSDSLLLADHFVAHHVAGRLLLGDEPPWLGARPFDERRRGYVLGEGAATCVLEAEEHARGRGARVYGAILGAGETCASPRGDEDGRSLEAAARAAMGDLRQPTVPHVDLVFATGIGTVADDIREARACRRLFPPPAPVQVTAATGALGVTGAASGAYGLVHALRSMASGTVPPTTGHEHADPCCAMPVVGRSEARAISSALVWTTDGARNVALLLGAVA